MLQIQRLTKNCPQVLRRCFSSQPTEDEFKTAKLSASMPGPGKLHFLWTMWKGGRKLNESFTDYHEEFGPIFKMEFGSALQVFIKDPEDAKKLHKADGRNPIEPGFDFVIYYRNHVRKDLFPKSAGLLGSHGEAWYEVRSKVQPSMMRPNSSLQYVSSIAGVSDRFLDQMNRIKDQNSEVEDILTYTKFWALESISTIFIDAKIDCLSENLPKDSDGAKLIYTMEEIHSTLSGFFMYSAFDYWKWMPMPALKTLDSAYESIVDICKKHIAKAIERYEANPVKDIDDMNVLEKMIQDCGPENDHIPVLMAVDAMAAGIETTGVTIAWFLYLLARNPKEQQKLYDEILEVVGTDDINGNNLNQMKYLSACLKETMRIRPAAGGVNRRTQKPIVLHGYQIPTGTVVTYFSMINGADGKLFNQPEKFMPERWLRDHPSNQESHAYALIPFGHGPRMCVGRRFAEMEARVCVVRTLQRFWLENGDKRIVESDTFMVNKPSGPLKIQFHERS